jgi:thymidylate synthase (FAD)
MDTPTNVSTPEVVTVKLMWITPDIEKMIVNIARVSNPENRDNMATFAALLRYLIKHKHWSPFEMGCMCIEVETTRAISAQIIRHSFKVQELSQRYAEVGMPKVPKLRRQDTKNRQASHDDLPDEIIDKYENKRIPEVFELLYQLYKDMLADGVAKECARMVLPMCTETTVVLMANIRDWMFYLESRCAPEAQFEHREVALQCAEIFKKQMPTIFEAMFPNGL